MAHFKKAGNVWRVQVAIKGYRASKSFSREADARAWAHGIEEKLRKRHELEALIAVGEGIPNFPGRILSALREIPYGADEIIRSAIPAFTVCGIYFLIRDDRIIYVGQSTNIYRRVARHIDDGKKFDRFSVVSCPKEDLDRIERMYITALYPDENMSLGNSSNDSDGDMKQAA